MARAKQADTIEAKAEAIAADGEALAEEILGSDTAGCKAHAGAVIAAARVIRQMGHTVAVQQAGGVITE